jgi:hypothetical protein
MRHPFLSLDNCPKISRSKIAYFMTEKPGLAMWIFISWMWIEECTTRSENNNLPSIGARPSSYRILDNPSLAYPIVGRLL